MSTSVKTRVQRGVKLLDEHVPDWRERVVVNEFDIRNSCRCVLGQVFQTKGFREGFSLGVDALGIERASDYGFDAKWKPGLKSGCGGDFDALQKEWLRVLEVIT